MKEHLKRLRKLLKGDFLMNDFIDRLESGYLTQEDYDKIADLSDPNCSKCDGGFIEVIDTPPPETERPVKLSWEICDCVLETIKE